MWTPCESNAANADLKNQMKEFNMDGRVLHELLIPPCRLREVVKLVMILSHGNACVESGNFQRMKKC